MTNRKERRARVRLGHRAPADLNEALSTVQCPDCDSEVWLDPEPYPHIEVRHDDTCPWYAELQRDLS